MCKQIKSQIKTHANVKEQFTFLVEEINKKYELLSVLSNDGLRSIAKDLKTYIEGCEDIQNALNAKVPEAFALVKEVARRFSVGDIEVTANDNDRKIAENVDFVLIKGDKAIYKNKWSVEGLPYQWSMVHYDEQLLGGILLHYGYAVEMATGEGKTLVATLPIFLNALSHAGLHMMTANSYLSKRDCEITRPVYMFLGLTVDCIEFYERRDTNRKKAYRSDITFGTTSAFTFDYLLDHLATDSKECVQRKHSYAIIDELDSILIDDANNPHIVGGGQYYDNSQVYKENIQYIRELVDSEDSTKYYTRNILQHSASFTELGIKWLREKKDNDDLFKTTKKYQIEDWDSLNEEEKDAIYSNLNLQNALHQLLLAMTVYEKDVDYVVTEANPPLNPDPCIIIIDQNTGRLRESNRWEHGLHTAIEVKEGVKAQKDFEGLGVISLKNYLRLYSKVAGMSGTILAAADELKELYGLNSTSLPTHKTNIRIDLPIRIFKTGREKDAAILETVKNVQQSGRPILIGCLTIKRAEYLTNLLRRNGVACNLLDARNEKDESWLVAKAGLGNTVTVATSIAGRGTDIKPDMDALINGGLMIVGADLFGSVRIDQQLKGRTGRQGNPGSSVFFASLEDPVLRYLSENDKRRLDNLAKEIPDQGTVSSDISSYFKLAQDNRENSFRKKRRETARKDDIIAPRRKTFYENRNAVLHNPKLADKIIDSIIDSEGLLRNDIYRKFQDIYDSLSIILKRSQFLNPDIKRLPVPFSCQGQPFALTFYIENLIFDFESLINDYKRQLILTTYDKYWKKFVLYILDDLDQKEIEGLEQKFTDMLDEVNYCLAKLISDTRIIFNPRQIENRKDITKLHKTRLKTKVEVPPYNPCPCGSGKKYCECHGGNTRNKAIRRR